MRLQLRHTALCLFGLMALIPVLTAQDAVQEEAKPIEIDFLSNYYAQEGNHSPVGGGIGSEKLSNISQSVVVNIPVKNGWKLHSETGLEFFTSASQNAVGANNGTGSEGDRDDDDDEYNSGASRRGRPPRAVIALGNFGFTKENSSRNTEYGLTSGFYRDDNATSGSVRSSWSRSTKDNNNTFSVTGDYYFDQWNLRDPGDIILGADHLGNGQRHTGSISLAYSRVFSKRITGALITDFVFQKGLLSTPYHQVYFTNAELPALEKLPDMRWKLPVGVRMNFHATDFMILRTYYRYYRDSWGIRAHTVSLEVPLKIGASLRLYPFYRYHTQAGADHFAPFRTLSVGESEFYTADYDLSTLQTHKAGIGLSVKPIKGVFRTKGERNPGRSFMLESIDVRYAYYVRSDGLTGHMITGGLHFNIFKADR